jgi:hypothetical protein
MGVYYILHSSYFRDPDMPVKVSMVGRYDRHDDASDEYEVMKKNLGAHESLMLVKLDKRMVMV